MTRILIVDDEPNNHRILTYTLSKAGYQTTTALNGRLALEALDTIEVDLAILDVAMPIMDGITLLEQLRGIDRFKALPVIILTGSGDDDQRFRVEDLGIQAFLTKPASSRVILETVNTLLSAHAQA